MTVKEFIEAYLDELKSCIGGTPKGSWVLFPDFFHIAYVIRARKCSNGVAIFFKRPAKKRSLTVSNSGKRAEEVFLPYLPIGEYSAVFVWGNAERVKITNVAVINFDFALDPAKGRKFQEIGQHFSRNSIMHLYGSTEVQMQNCPISGVDDRGKVRRLIHFLWTMTGDCVILTEHKARSYARDDFSQALDYALHERNVSRLPRSAKQFLLEELEKLKREFGSLISRTDIDEQEIQDFLENHRFALDSSARQIWFKQRLGAQNQADFITGYSESMRIVEIKRPSDRIFDEHLRLSVVTQEALSEVQRYRQWIESNTLEITRKYGSARLEKSWVIVGMKSEMSEDELTALVTWNTQNESITMMSFDDLLKNYDLRIKQIEDSSQFGFGDKALSNRKQNAGYHGEKAFP